jgi:hypothetical protein
LSLDPAAVSRLSEELKRINSRKFADVQREIPGAGGVHGAQGKVFAAVEKEGGIKPR